MNRTVNEADDDDFELPKRGADRRTDGRIDPRTDARENVYRDGRAHDRELTLSTGTVLGLFFALALVCAVFFGFGYTMGRKSSQPAADMASAATGATETATTDAPANKPAAGSPAIQAIPGYMSQHEADAANRSAATQGYKPNAAASSSNSASTTVTLPMNGAAATSRPASTQTTDTASVPRKKPAADPTTAMTASIKPAPVVIKPAATTASTAAPTSTTFFNNAATANAANAPIYVQVAAVSHKEDAESLLAGLKQRGYSAFERSLDTDKLIHIQVGPFNTKQSADAMKARLQGSGYNAILK